MLRAMRIILFFLMLFLPMQAMAIINAEDIDVNLDKDGVGGNVGMSASGNSGNSTKLHGEAGGKVVWKHGVHTDMLVGSYAYGSSRGKRDTNKAFGHLRHRYGLNDHWELEAFGQLQKDEFSRLKLRTLLGGGVRWSHQGGGWQNHIGLGSFYEREQLNTATLPVSRLWRVNTYWATAYQLNDHVDVQNTVYYQPAWKGANDFRLLDDVALRIALTSSLNLRLSLETVHDSRPPAGIKSTDLNYKTGLELDF